MGVMCSEAGTAEDLELEKPKPLAYKKKSPLFCGSYKNDKLGVYGFVNLWSGGKLVAPRKYRWVVRVEYCWIDWQKNNGGFRAQIKPDIIADPIKAMVLVEGFMNRLGFKKFYPQRTYTEIGSDLDACKNLVKSLGFEPIDNWPEAKVSGRRLILAS